MTLYGGIKRGCSNRVHIRREGRSVDVVGVYEIKALPFWRYNRVRGARKIRFTFPSLSSTSQLAVGHHGTQGTSYIQDDYLGWEA